MNNQDYTIEQQYICFLYQVVTGGFFAPATVDDLTETTDLANRLIQKYGEDYHLNRLNEKVRELIKNNELPEMLRS
tara:strand:+ start:177 stop:404 length:228 start_codon:yes stop_codon:yes gene_type:complete